MNRIWNQNWKNYVLCSSQVAKSQTYIGIKYKTPTYCTCQCKWNLTYILASLELIDVNVDNLGSSECLLQWPKVRVVFRRGLPQLPKQQWVLHDPLDRFDEQWTHVQQVGFPSVQISIAYSKQWSTWNVVIYRTEIQKRKRKCITTI